MNQTAHFHKALTLLEVLIAIGIIGIGLLGVLAVIPLGAYQVSKGEHAKHTANMLANAAEDLKVRELAKPETWDSTVTTLDCTDIVSMRDKYPDLQEWMRGQDDFEFKDDEIQENHPDFNNKKSTGRYTWFFTYYPTAKNGIPTASVSLTELNDADVDLLGCYNRVESDDAEIEVSGYTSALGNGGTITLKADEQLENLEKIADTKYVLLTWQETIESTDIRRGTWCKVLFFDKNNRKLIISGEGAAIPNPLPFFIGNADKCPKINVKSGVLYHKRIEGVKLTKKT